jgi:hypothetical protein
MRLALLLICTLSFPALAQVYKWTDANGVTHFGSQPPPGQQEQVPIRKNSHKAAAPENEPSQVQTIERKDRFNPVESSRNAQNEIRRLANERACRLANLELESAERLLTLALSQRSYDFVVNRREKAVADWRKRAEMHCNAGL